MSDIYSKEKRTEIMSKISATETKPEIMIRKFLFSKGFRYRKNVKSLPGKPDIVLNKRKIVIFVNGCFWHGHHCKSAKLPHTRRDFWEAKINSNIERDKRNFTDLKKAGFKVIIVWQCEIKTKFLFETKMKSLIKKLVN